MPTVTVVVGLVSTLLVGSAILGSLQAIKTTSLDPNADRTQQTLDQVGDKTITISASDSDMAKKQMQGAIVWNMLAASDCRILATTSLLTQGGQSDDFDPDEMPTNPVDGKAFKVSTSDFLSELAENEGNGYTGNFDSFLPLEKSGFGYPCIGTQSTIKEVEDATKNAQNDFVSTAFSGAYKAVGAGLVITGIASCPFTGGSGCVAAAAGVGMVIESDFAGDMVGQVIVPGGSEDIGAEPGFDMEGVFSRMDFDVEKSFLMGTDDYQDPFLGLALKFDKPKNTPGFWRGKRLSYLLPAGLDPDSFDKIDHRIFASQQEIDGVLCLDNGRNRCPPFTETGGTQQEPGGLYVLNQIYSNEDYTLSDTEALRVANERIEWILDNKDLFSTEPNVRLQERLEGIESKNEFVSEVRSDASASSSRGMPLTMLFGRFVIQGNSFEESGIELIFEDRETIPDSFPDEDVSGKYSLVELGSDSEVLVKEDFKDAAPGTEQERKRMMFYSFRPRMENVPIVSGEPITEDDLTEGCAGSCTDMERLRNLMTRTSYLFCEGASGQIQSNAGHISSSDEATSQESAVEDQVYPKVEITEGAKSCMPTATLSGPDQVMPENVNLDCGPESIIDSPTAEIFYRQTAERGANTVNAVCGTDGEERSADLGEYGNVDYQITQKTMSREGCSADWYDITTDSDVGGNTLQEGDYPTVLEKEGNAVWTHDYSTNYNDGDGQNEIGGSGKNNRITYDRLSVKYNASEVQNLTYKVSIRGLSSEINGQGTNTVTNTIIVEELPNSSQTIVRLLEHDPSSSADPLKDAKKINKNFSGAVRELVIDRTSSGGIAINGERLTGFYISPRNIAITSIDISPVRDVQSYNQRYDWSVKRRGDIPSLEPTQTDLEIRNVQSYSQPRVCKGDKGIWKREGREVIEG